MKDFGFCERWILDGVWLCEVFVNWTMMEGSNEVVMEEKKHETFSCVGWSIRGMFVRLVVRMLRRK